MIPSYDVNVPRLAVPVGPRDHLRGPANAPVTLVEYGDFECPYCARAHLVVDSVLRKLGKRVRFVFRHFPLRTVHPHAEVAAETAEAAGQQGKFWEMHDMLFENQHALEPEDLIGYAEALGLDANRVANELATRVHEPRVRADFTSGVRSGVNGTPSFFINGVRHDGSWEEPGLTIALQRAYAEATR